MVDEKNYERNTLVKLGGYDELLNVYGDLTKHKKNLLHNLSELRDEQQFIDAAFAVTTEERYAKKHIIKSLNPDEEDALLQILPATTGTLQYRARVNEKDKPIFDEVSSYLIKNGAEGLYVTGSSLRKEDYNDIDVVAVYPDAEEGTKAITSVENSEFRHVSSIEKCIVPYMVEGLEYRIKFQPKDENAVPIDVGFITKSTLEKALSE